MPNTPETLPAELAEPLAAAGRRLGMFARTVWWYPEISSTNTVAGQLADAGCEEGHVLVADAQTAGRGRHGRSWASPAGAGLYFSIVLRPPRESASLLTIAAGVAVADGILAATGLEPDLKWPNDLYVGTRKLAGILAESGSAASGEPHVVLGCGINIMPAAYPSEVAGRATSLEAELGRAVDRGAVLAECLAALAARYEDLQAERRAEVLTAWRTRAALTFGRQLEWDLGGSVRRGVAEGIDDGGALLVRTTAGLERVISGEIRWI